jgi:hypothetical protein
MPPEAPEVEPPYDDRLESCLLHGPVDDVVDLLRGSGRSGDLDSGNALDHLMRLNRDRFDVSHQADVALCIEDPRVLARCLYEIEQRNTVQASALLGKVERALDGEDVGKLHSFLARLRESGEQNDDGGAGDREPLVPHDPRDGGAIALEPPREEDVHGAGLEQAGEELIDTVRRMPI